MERARHRSRAVQLASQASIYMRRAICVALGNLQQWKASAHALMLPPLCAGCDVDLEGDDASRAVAYEVLADLCAAGVVESMHDMDSGEALDMHRLCPRLAPTTESR